MEPLFAAIVLAVCIVMLARLMIGERLRYRLDAALRRAWRPFPRAWHSARRAVASLQQRRRVSRSSKREAEEMIRRARRPASGKGNGKGNGKWEGNVFHPDSLDEKPRKPH